MIGKGPQARSELKIDPRAILKIGLSIGSPILGC